MRLFYHVLMCCHLHLQSGTWGAHKGIIHPEKSILITTCPIWQPKTVQQALNLATQTAVHSWAVVWSSLTELFICLFELLFFTQLHFYPPHLCCPAFTQHLLVLTALEVIYKHFFCCRAQLCTRGLFRVCWNSLSNASWKLLGCDQKPYHSDSLINIKHSVRKKKAHKHCTAS